MKPKKQNPLILPALLLSAGMSHAAVIAYVGLLMIAILLLLNPEHPPV